MPVQEPLTHLIEGAAERAQPSSAQQVTQPRTRLPCQLQPHPSLFLPRHAIGVCLRVVPAGAPQDVLVLRRDDEAQQLGGQLKRATLQSSLCSETSVPD